MPRAKKDNVPVSLRMDKEIYAALSDFCEISGQPKTVAIERAIREYVKENGKKFSVDGKDPTDEK